MSLREEMYSAGNTVNDIVIFFFFFWPCCMDYRIDLSSLARD